MLRLAALLLIFLPSLALADVRLLMAEQAGCIYCERWDAEIAPAYPKTAEGAAAPLQRYDLRAGPPDGVALARRVIFTPTFVLVEDGREVARMEGYAGDEFFWFQLRRMLDEAEISLETGG